MFSSRMRRLTLLLQRLIFLLTICILLICFFNTFGPVDFYKRKP